MKYLRITYPYWWQRLIPGWKQRWKDRIDRSLGLDHPGITEDTDGLTEDVR